MKTERKSKPKSDSKYKEVKCAIKKGMKALKKKWIERQCRIIEKGMTRDENKRTIIY